MFRKYFAIQLDNPCSENWENMLPADRGRFCNACSKQVVDFTAMSDADIVAYFNKHKNVCGRFYNEQLDRNLLPYTRKQTLFGKAIAAVMLLFQTFISEAQTPNVKPKAVIEQSAQSKQNYGSECSKMIPGDSGSFKIKILVTDFLSFHTLPNARVIINGDTIECLSDSGGLIEIELPVACMDSSVKLGVIKEGYYYYEEKIILKSQTFHMSLLKFINRPSMMGGAAAIINSIKNTAPKPSTK